MSALNLTQWQLRFDFGAAPEYKSHMYRSICWEDQKATSLRSKNLTSLAISEHKSFGLATTNENCIFNKRFYTWIK